MEKLTSIPTYLVVIVCALTSNVAALADDDERRRGRPAPTIGAANIEFTGEHVIGLDVRAFIPTGSLSRNCIVSLAESNAAVPGISVFCGPREFEGKMGLLVSLFFPFFVPSLDDFFITATVYQEGARSYGSPVVYTEQ